MEYKRPRDNVKEFYYNILDPKRKEKVLHDSYNPKTAFNDQCLYV